MSGFHVSAKVPTPPQEMRLLIDTGGNTTWMNSANSDIYSIKTTQEKYIRWRMLCQV